jgi:N-acetylmuramoyl-L-alanine amidase
MLAKPTPPRTIARLVIHCSATPSGQRLAKPGLSPAVVIDGWHKARGFARQSAAVAAFNPKLGHIGYHYIIDLNGSCETGRADSEAGAHVAGHNADSVGICLVGGAEREARYTLAQWLMLETVVLKYRHMLGGDLPVVGHRDLSPDLNGDGQIKPNEWLKTCPGFDVAAWLANGMEPTAAQVCGVLA